MSRARELSKLGNINVLSADDVSSEVGIASTVPRSTLDVRGELQVGTGIQVGPAGVVTATSFSGSGANLTGLATTETVRADTLTVAGVSTLTGVTNVTGVANFASAVNADATTDSTSTSTGALIVDGGVGIAKNVYIGAGLSVAGTLTYEDVTNVDSVGLITAKSGVNVSGGQVTIGTGITMGIAGVATFSGTSDVHLLDNVKLNLGDGSDLSIYHDGSSSYIDNATGVLYLRASDMYIKKADGSETVAAFIADSFVKLYHNGVESVRTSSTGITVRGPEAGDAVIGLYADEGDDNADLWRVKADTSGNLGIDNYSTGSWVNGLSIDGSNHVTVTNNLILNTDSYLKIGAGSDLQLTHNGSNSYVNNSTGHLYIRSGTGIDLTNAAGSENYVVCTENGSVKIYYDHSNKLETTNDGVVVTGISTATSFTDSLGALRDIPLRSVTGSAATLVVADAGKVVSTNTTGWTVPASTFSEGDTVTLLNNSAGGLVITCSAVTTYLTTDGSTVTSSTLGARGLATLYFVSASVAYLQGTALS